MRLSLKEQFRELRKVVQAVTSVNRPNIWDWLVASSTIRTALYMRLGDDERAIADRLLNPQPEPPNLVVDYLLELEQLASAIEEEPDVPNPNRRYLKRVSQ